MILNLRLRFETNIEERNSFNSGGSWYSKEERFLGEVNIEFRISDRSANLKDYSFYKD